MRDLAWFLPSWPPAFGNLALFGAVLLAGLAGGELARRFAALPRITGCVLVGVLCGPQGLGLLAEPMGAGARAMIDLALGVAVFELGHRLHFGWLARNRWLALAAAGESLGAFAAVYAALSYVGYAPLLAAGAAAVGAATSPAVVLMVTGELRASGQITERMLLFTAVNCVAAYVALALVLPMLHLQQQATWRSAILHPMYLLGGAALLALAASHALIAAARWLGKDEDRQFILLAGGVVLAVGLARAFGLPVVAVLLALGIFMRNLDDAHAVLPVRFGQAGHLLLVALFVLTGASLDFSGLRAAGAVAGLFIVARFLGKAAAILAFARLSGLRAGGAGLLSVALLPMSGLAVVMTHDTAVLFPGFGAELAAVVLSAAAALELIGPIATQFALRHAGEAHPERGA